MTDREVVEKFVAYLRDNGHPGLKIIRYPEDENRNSKDIDAIADHLAIEHTSVDTIPNQRQKSDWFMKAAAGLEAELPKPPFRLRIAFSYDAIKRGQDWATIREALKKWILHDAPLLSDGRYTIDNIQGVPFTLHVSKASDRMAGIFFARFAPDDKSLPERIRKQFDIKASKLCKYKENKYITILLVESDDLALMNEVIMLDAIRKAYLIGLPYGVDQIWFVDTSIPEQLVFHSMVL